MKKYILIAAGVVIASSAYSQKNKVVSAYNYNKAFERSNKCKELANGIEAINLAFFSEERIFKGFNRSSTLFFGVLSIFKV